MHESSLFISKPVSLWLEMKEREDVWHLVAPACGLPLGTLFGGHWHPKEWWVLRPGCQWGPPTNEFRAFGVQPLAQEVTPDMWRELDYRILNFHLKFLCI